MIGITGNIGSGKSTIAEELERRGYPVYYTDKEAKRLIMNNQQVKQQMIDLFGESIYSDNYYHTDIVAKQVFGNTEKLQQLNQIVHPAVRQDLAQWKGKFVESAILFESGLDKLCQSIIVVVAPEEVRLERVMQRDHSSKEQVLARMASQMSTEELIQRADYSVDNDGKTSIKILVDNLLQHLNIL